MLNACLKIIYTYTNLQQVFTITLQKISYSNVTLLVGCKSFFFCNEPRRDRPLLSISFLMTSVHVFYKKDKAKVLKLQTYFSVTNSVGVSELHETTGQISLKEMLSIQQRVVSESPNYPM